MKFDMSSCGGCRTCEMACSFHHTGKFMPSVSSLVIVDKEDGPGCEVMLIRESDGTRMACDGCDGLDVPLCMDYCREIDDLGEILFEFDAKHGHLKGSSKKKK